MRVVVAAVLALAPSGVRPNSPPHRHERVLQQPAALQVRQQPGDRLVDLAGVVRVVALASSRAGPTCSCACTCTKRTPASREPAGHQALPAEVVGRLVVDAVELVRRLRSRRERSCTAGAAVCIRNASSNDSMRPSSAASGPVERGARGSRSREQVELQPLLARAARGALHEWHRDLAGRACRRCPSGVRLIHGGQERRRIQLFTPPCVSVGQMVTKPGRSRFSVPRP